MKRTLSEIEKVQLDIALSGIRNMEKAITGCEDTICEILQVDLDEMISITRDYADADTFMEAIGGEVYSTSGADQWTDDD